MSKVSSVRLYLLRSIYLLITVAMGLNIWPLILKHDKIWEINEGAVICMMGALTALSALGVRYPIQMLPLLFWEIAWKTIWLIVVAMPLWLNDQMDEATSKTAFACSLVVLVYIAVPWKYVFANYVVKTGDTWKFKDLSETIKG